MKRWGAALALLLSTLLAGTSAHADDSLAVKIATAPADAPTLTSEQAATLPAPPADFHSKDAGWLRLVYPPADEERIAHLVEVANQEKALLSNVFGTPVLEHLEFRLARTPEQMAELAPKGLPPPSYASGVAYNGLHLIEVSRTAPVTFEAVDVEETLRHELVHVALEDATTDHPVPRWFNEGLAVFESGEGSWARRGVLWQAVLAGTIIPLDELDSHFPTDHNEVGIAYAESADFMRYLMRTEDRQRFQSLITRVREGTPFSRALDDAYSTDLRKLEYHWRQEISHRYGLIPFILTSGSALWAFAVVLFAFGYARKRREAKDKLRRWEREEAAIDAAHNAAHLARIERSLPHEEPVIRAPEVPLVEHGGSWHTLH